MKKTWKGNKALYISEGEMVHFINENSDMEWNDVCDFLRDKKILNPAEGMRHVTKSELYNKNVDDYIKKGYHSKEYIEWMRAFFETHEKELDGIEEIMFVFDD